MPREIRTWGSFCNERERGTGSVATSAFPAPRVLRLYLAGYPSGPGLSLQIERISDGSKFEIRPTREPHEYWLLCEFSLPRSWRGSPVRLVARDQNTGPAGWLAFSELLKPNDTGFQSAAILFLMTAGHFLLILLPGLAVCAWAVYRGIRTTLTVGLLLLATIGTSGYLIFWLYFIQPRLGYTAAFVLPIAAVLFLVWIAPKLDIGARSVFKPLFPPVALTGAAALLVLSTGFLFGGFRDPLHTASVRFSHPLPPDNELPLLFAEDLHAGHIPKPFFIDWLTSDRPPLQTGLALSQYPFFMHPRPLGYTIVSVLGQSLWVLAVWLLLIARGIRRPVVTLVLFASLFSGFIFLNSFYVWPKLLAGAFTLGFFAVLFGNQPFSGSGERTLRFTTGGALLAFGLLSHGGTAFAVIGAIAAAVLLRRRLPLKGIALMAIATAALYFPWTLYQKFVDPPGNRLVKMHIAAHPQVDSVPVTTAILTAYRGLTLQQWLDYKWINVQSIAGHDSEYWKQIGGIVRDLIAGNTHRGKALQLAADARVIVFFHFVPSFGFLVTGFFALLAGVKKRFRTKEWKASAIFSLVIFFSLCDWTLLMFVPGMTIIHAGAYALNLLAFVASVLALWSVSPWLAVILSALQVALNIMLYAILMRGFVPDGPLPEGYLRFGMLLLCLLALAGCVYLLMLASKDSTDASGSTADPLCMEAQGGGSLASAESAQGS